MKSISIIIIFVILLSYNSFAQQSSCDYKVEILLNSTEFEKNDFNWKLRAIKIQGVSSNITGIAEIENLKGEIVRRYKPWTSESISRQKTSSKYTPNLKEGSYKIKAEINISCDDINKINNFDSKTFLIKEGNNQYIILEKAENITVNNTLTEKITNDKNYKTISGGNKNKIIEQKSAADAAQEPKIIYESSNEKSKGMILIFLLVLSVVLNIVLIWKR